MSIFLQETLLNFNKNAFMEEALFKFIVIRCIFCTFDKLFDTRYTSNDTCSKYIYFNFFKACQKKFI